ncbi:MAG TPA: hypothetical protein VN223_08430 [Candidatus Elarobacter sp.]|nr:hypothetical protein [Candidatus Elarobacter sp.]
MNALTTLLLILLLSFPLFAQSHDENMYACKGKTFMEETESDQATVLSPDGRNRIAMLRPKVFTIFLNDRSLRTVRYPAISASIEMGWSSDSTQFFITYSAAGAIGEYHTHLFQIVNGKVKESRVAQTVAAHFRQKHFCAARPMNNLSFLGWTADSRQAILVAEVYPTGDCRQGALFRGYVVDTRKQSVLKILREEQTESIKQACYKSGLVAF